MQLTLPVKPYTRKFLERHLGAHYQLSNVDAFGRYLYCLLREPRRNSECEEYLGIYTAKFPVRIVPYLLYDRACKNCSAYVVHHFNCFVERIFYDEFHTFVQARVEDGLMEAKEAIERFCAKHKLSEDDVRYETMKRNWQRYWKKEKKRLKDADSPTELSLAA